MLELTIIIMGLIIITGLFITILKVNKQVNLLNEKINEENSTVYIKKELQKTNQNNVPTKIPKHLNEQDHSKSQLNEYIIVSAKNTDNKSTNSINSNVLVLKGNPNKQFNEIELTVRGKKTEE